MPLQVGNQLLKTLRRAASLAFREDDRFGVYLLGDGLLTLPLLRPHIKCQQPGLLRFVLEIAEHGPFPDPRAAEHDQAPGLLRRNAVGESIKYSGFVFPTDDPLGIFFPGCKRVWSF